MRILLIIVFLIILFPQNGPEKLTKPPTDALLELRDFQYEDNKRLNEQIQLQLRFKQLEAERTEINQNIEKWIRKQADIQKIDLTTHVFDLDKKDWIVKEKKQ